MKVKVSNKHGNFNIAGCVGEVVGVDGKFKLVLVAGNVWRVKASHLR